MGQDSIVPKHPPIDPIVESKLAFDCAQSVLSFSQHSDQFLVSMCEDNSTLINWKKISFLYLMDGKADGTWTEGRPAHKTLNVRA